MPHQQSPLTEHEAQFLAQGLRLIPAHPLANTPATQEIEKLWYQGPERYFDVFIHLAQSKIDWVQITFRGQYVEWKDHKVKTGSTNEFTVATQAEHPASKMLHAHEHQNAMLIANVAKVIGLKKDDAILAQVSQLLLSNI